MTRRGRQILKWAAVGAAVVAFAVVYAFFDPAENYFPRCPFKWATGLDCPGCGSQRAVHDLLNLDIRGALRENLLLLVAIPYMIVGFVFDMAKSPSARMALWRKRMFGTRAIIVVLSLIIGFWVLRNIPFFADYI